METFELGGHRLAIDDRREAYNALRLKYQALAVTARTDFLSAYPTFASMDDIHQRFIALARAKLEPAVDNAIRDLVAAGIYDVDDAAFLDRYVSRYNRWEQKFEAVEQPYLQITMNSAELEAHRVARRANRGRVIGGGFGAEGAIRGAAGAWEANIAFGALHGIANTMGRAASNVSDRRKKEALFANPSTRSDLADAVYQLVFDVHLAVVDAIHEHLTTVVYQPVSEADGAKALAVVENVQKGRISTEDVAERILDALQLDPYGVGAYTEWLQRFGDRDQKLSKTANHFGVTAVEEDRERVISQYRRSLRFDTPEHCHESLASLIEFAAAIGVVNFEKERNDIMATATRLDREKRTVAGKTFDTVGEADLARAARDEELSRTLDGHIYEKRDEADAARALKLENERKTRLTFNGTLYGSDEELGDARRKHNKRTGSLAATALVAALMASAVFGRSAGSFLCIIPASIVGIVVARQAERRVDLYFNVIVFFIVTAIALLLASF